MSNERNKKMRIINAPDLLTFIEGLANCPPTPSLLNVPFLPHHHYHYH